MYGTFDGAAPDWQLQGHQLRLGHAALVLDDVRALRADRLAVAASTERLHGRNALLPLAWQEEATRWGAPPRARFRPPIFAERCDLAEVWHRLIQGQQCLHLLRCQAERVPQEGEPFPDPRRPIGDHAPLLRVGDRAALPGGAEQGAHRIGPCERGVHDGGQAGLTLAFSIHHRDAHPRGARHAPRERRWPLLVWAPRVRSRRRMRPPSRLIPTRRPATVSANAAGSICGSSRARAASR